jgi:hypothetical protein
MKVYHQVISRPPNQLGSLNFFHDLHIGKLEWIGTCMEIGFLWNNAIGLDIPKTISWPIWMESLKNLKEEYKLWLSEHKQEHHKLVNTIQYDVGIVKKSHAKSSIAIHQILFFVTSLLHLAIVTSHKLFHLHVLD